MQSERLKLEIAAGGAGSDNRCVCLGDRCQILRKGQNVEGHLVEKCRTALKGPIYSSRLRPISLGVEAT